MPVKLTELLLPIELAQFRLAHIRDCLQASPALAWSPSLVARVTAASKAAGLVSRGLAAEFTRQKQLGRRLTVFYWGRVPLPARMASHTEAFELVHPSLADAELFLANRVARALAARVGSMRQLRRWLRQADVAAMQSALRACPSLQDIVGANAANVMLVLKKQAQRPEALVLSVPVQSEGEGVGSPRPSSPGKALAQWAAELDSAFKLELQLKSLVPLSRVPTKPPPAKPTKAPGAE